MSIFSSRDPKPSKPSSAPPPAARPPQAGRTGSTQAGPEKTLIATGSRVVGEIRGSAELVIDGEVEGHIDLDSLVVVGSKGYVEGEIRARSVQVGGKVLGNIRGRERVEVQDSGRLEGDVEAPSVIIAEGAFFKGKIEMTGDRDAPKAGDRPVKEKRTTAPVAGTSPSAGPPASSAPPGGGAASSKQGSQAGK
jgi:cytoskeletal protein CcmA (bactofilin family)